MGKEKKTNRCLQNVLPWEPCHRISEFSLLERQRFASSKILFECGKEVSCVSFQHVGLKSGHFMLKFLLWLDLGNLSLSLPGSISFTAWFEC